jgi:hypothetical protein
MESSPLLTPGKKAGGLGLCRIILNNINLFFLKVCLVADYYIFAYQQMKRLITYSGKISLSVATLVIMLHLLIPHDHHQENFCTGNEKPPLQESHNHPGMPSHCHAFNDLASGDKNQLIVNQFSIGEFTVQFNQANLLPCTGFISAGGPDHSPDITNSHLSEQSLLRAPPVIS